MPYAQPISIQILVADNGDVFVEWSRESGPPSLVGWHVERRQPDGTAMRLTSEPVAPGLFDGPAERYRVQDADVTLHPGDSGAYRLVVVDLELQEWPTGFATVIAEREQPAVAAPAPRRARTPPGMLGGPDPGVGPRVRIVVTNDAIYELTAAQIASVMEGYDEAGVIQAMAEANLSLSSGGAPVAWRAAPGGAALQFYGQAYRDVFTRRNVYWLEAGPGAVMSVSDLTTSDVVNDAWFWDTHRMEQNLHFVPMAAGDVDDDYWVWAGQSLTTPATSWTWSTNVPVVDLHPDHRTGTVTAYLLSGYDGFVEFDNRTRLRAAGQTVDDRQWRGTERLAQSGIATNLTGGSVPVAIDILREPHVTTTVVYIDALDVRYARRMRASGNRLMFQPEPGASSVTVRGFTSPDILVLDITDPLQPVEVLATVAPDGAEWRASWVVDPDVPGRFAAVAGVAQPVESEGVTGNVWGGPRAGAPHVVITSKALTNAATALVVHRQQNGMDSILVPMEELYNDFTHGRPDPRAITHFLAHALTSWDTPPVYVCLAGDGHLDYHDYYNQSTTRPNHVPPAVDKIINILVPGNNYETMGVDTPLADISGDRLPDVALGRLPAQTPAALTHMINRIIQHESSLAWKNRILLVADKDGNNAFHHACDRLATRISPGITVQRVTHSNATPVATIRSLFLQAVNSGPVLSFYIGHANNIGLSAPYFFQHSSTLSHVTSLTNHLRTSVLVGGTCMLNNFARPHPDNRCIGKGMMDTASGGMVGVWASAAASTLHTAEKTSEVILDELMDRQSSRLGDLIMPALVYEAQSMMPWLVDASVTLGDPATLVQTHLYTPLLILTPVVHAPAVGASGLQVDVQADIPWTATAPQPWITITDGHSMGGDGQVVFNVAVNAGTARSGAIVIAGGGIVRTTQVQQAAAQVQVTLSAEPAQGGQTLGAGTYEVGQSAQVVAEANPGWQFQAWDDGNDDNPRTIPVVPGGVSRVATFIPSGGMWPSGNMVVLNRRPTFFWEETPGATWYYVAINRNGQSYERIWVQAGATWTPTTDMPGGLYQWWIRPWSPATGNGPWSAEARFTIPVRPPSEIVQIAPQGAQGGNQPLYRWQTDEQATWYRLWVGRVGIGRWLNRWFEIAGPGEAEVNPAVAYPGPSRPVPVSPMGAIGNTRPRFEWSGGACEWYVHGWGPDGSGPWSGPMYFSVPFASGTWCRVVLQRSSNTVLDEWTNNTSFVPPILPTGNYSWWLAVWDAQRRRTYWSDRVDFTITP